MQKPSKAERLALVSLYARKLQAQQQRAHIRDQERADQAFTRKLEHLQAKYPELLRVLSQDFFDALETAARKFIATQAITGPGKDW